MIEAEPMRRKDIIVGLEVWGGIIVLMAIAVVLLMRPNFQPIPALVMEPTLDSLPTVTPLPTTTPFPTPTSLAVLIPTPTVAALPVVANGDVPAVEDVVEATSATALLDTAPAESPSVETASTNLSPATENTTALTFATLSLSQTGAITYVVQAGDTLSVIAENLGVAMEDLMALNELEDEIIYLDQVLIIPEAGAERALAVASARVMRVVHTVVSGDTLGTIALHYGVDVDELRALNALDSDLIQLGQELTIPEDAD